MSTVKVPLWQSAARFTTVDPEATKGAVLGRNLYAADGVTLLTLDALNPPASSGETYPATIWERVLYRPENVDALANTTTLGLYVITGIGHSATRTLVSTTLALGHANGVDDNPSIDLAELPDTGAGTFKLIDRDAYGRVQGSKDGTTDDVPEGTTNLYFTNQRARDAIGDLGTMAYQDSNAVAIMGGTIDGTTVGATTPASGAFTSLSSTDDAMIHGVTVGLGPGANAGNLVVGGFALTNRTTATAALAVGFNSLMSLTTGANDLAIGNGALKNTDTGTTNIGIGVNAGRDNKSGSQNTIIGEGAFLLSTAATGNMAIGRQSLRTYTATGSTFNTALGNNSFDMLASGTFNTGVGNSVGSLQTSGGRNCYFGRRAGVTATAANANISGQSCTYVGTDSGPGSPTQVSFATALGADALVTSSNTVVLGRTTDIVAIGATGNDGSGARLQVVGSINLSGITLLGSYMLTTLPMAAANTGGICYVSNSPVRPTIAMSDGTAWRRPDSTLVTADPVPNTWLVRAATAPAATAYGLTTRIDGLRWFSTTDGKFRCWINGDWLAET